MKTKQHIMELAAISTACIQNTESTIKDRIPKTNPYWTVAYGDVCTAVDREMKWRESYQHLESQFAISQLRLADAVNVLEHLLALYMHTVYGSYDGKTEQPTPVEQARKIIQEHKP